MRALILLTCMASMLLAVPQTAIAVTTRAQGAQPLLGHDHEHTVVENDRDPDGTEPTDAERTLLEEIAIAIGLMSDVDGDDAGDDADALASTELPPEDQHEALHPQVAKPLLFALIPPGAHGSDDECPDGWGRTLIRPPNQA